MGGKKAIYGFSQVLDNYDLFCGNRENEIRQKSHFEGRSNRIWRQIGPRDIDSRGGASGFSM